jgi:hypothetical protein
MSEDDFDLEKLRLRPEDIAAYAGKAGTAAARARRQDRFVIVPATWADRLAAAHKASTFKLALYLLYRHWKNDGRRITLANVSLAGTGVSRHQKWRALNELERLKLIAVERRTRKSPHVTLLKTRASKGDHHG